MKYILLVLLFIVTGCTGNTSISSVRGFELMVEVEDISLAKGDEFKATSYLTYKGKENILIETDELIYMYIYDESGKEISAMNYYLDLNGKYPKIIDVATSYNLVIEFEPEQLVLQLKPGSYEFRAMTNFNAYMDDPKKKDDAEIIYIEVIIDFEVE